jgi:uncharacterized protein YPO0396
MKNQSKHLKWLETQVKKDEANLQREKEDFINSLKKLKKDDILPKVEEPKKLTLWQKVKKVLMGL